MSTRFAKQLVYGAFYAVFWFLVVTLIYGRFIKQAPSCFDHVQNQGEQGVDCGGPCATVCTAGAQPISVLAVNTFASSAGHDTFLARVANPNLDFASQNFAYSVELYDTSGTLVASIPGQSFIYASEAKYLALVNQEVPASFDHANVVIATGTQWIGGEAMGNVPEFSIRNVVTQPGQSTIAANGELTNNDVVTFTPVLVIAIFKDPQGNPIGASETQIDNIAPGETKDFSVIYPLVSGVNTAATEIDAYALR